MTKKKKPKHSIGDTVYFTAYLKSNPSAFYICHGTIERKPEPGVRKYWKVKVNAIGDRPVGGKQVVEQAALLGVTLSKKSEDLTKELSSFLRPPDWIEKKK